MNLKVQLRAAASAYAPLTALLGSSPFRWWDLRLVQGSDFPAIVVTLVSGSPTYVTNGRLQTGFTRVQFTIWDLLTSVGTARAMQVEDALTNFLSQCNLIGVPNLSQYSNLIVMQRDGMFPAAEPSKVWRLIDAQIFSNDTL